MTDETTTENAHKPSSHRSFDDMTHGRKRTKRDTAEVYLCFCQKDNCNALEPFVEMRRFVREEYDLRQGNKRLDIKISQRAS